MHSSQTKLLRGGGPCRGPVGGPVGGENVGYMRRSDVRRTVVLPRKSGNFENPRLPSGSVSIVNAMRRSRYYIETVQTDKTALSWRGLLPISCLPPLPVSQYQVPVLVLVLVPPTANSTPLVSFSEMSRFFQSLFGFSLSFSLTLGSFLRVSVDLQVFMGTQRFTWRRLEE